jgi:hypothetical protein
MYATNAVRTLLALVWYTRFGGGVALGVGFAVISLSVSDTDVATDQRQADLMTLLIWRGGVLVPVLGSGESVYK